MKSGSSGRGGIADLQELADLAREAGIRVRQVERAELERVPLGSIIRAR
jgi:nucleotide-binding universal stress UspA family protein